MKHGIKYRPVYRHAAHAGRLDGIRNYLSAKHISRGLFAGCDMWQAAKIIAGSAAFVALVIGFVHGTALAVHVTGWRGVF